MNITKEEATIICEALLAVSKSGGDSPLYTLARKIEDYYCGLDVSNNDTVEMQVTAARELASCRGHDRAVDQAIDAILLANKIHPEVRNSDSLDFHDLSVTHLRSMLAAAWLVGRGAEALPEADQNGRLARVLS